MAAGPPAAMLLRRPDVQQAELETAGAETGARAAATTGGRAAAPRFGPCGFLSTATFV